MGVQLGDLVEAKKISIDDLSGRAVAFDGHNILYQFLAIIRGQGGESLRDSRGNVTSRLSGLIYRNSNLMEAGIRVVYVLDGEPRARLSLNSPGPSDHPVIPGLGENRRSLIIGQP